ncbi:MAG: peptide ABC transporter permease [Oceanospirillaceae bacterium]|nr:peptide ABC transporter permease [Oceanospirillaceae bacterium]MBT12822.1 peptide ABC transporter permease [Oceanospirillaceae bacterium]
MIKPVVLWSDVLIFLLVLAMAGFFWTLRKQPLTAKRWLSVFRTHTGIASFIVILFYLSIAVMDSLHYRQALEKVGDSDQVHYDQEVRSVLDWLLKDLNAHNETTYSEPMSLYSFSKINMQDDNGQVYRDYPRLKEAGSHIEAEEHKTADVLQRTLAAVLTGLLISALLIVPHYWLYGRHRQAIPWMTGYATLTALIVLSSWVLMLGQVYHVFGTDKVGGDTMYQSIKAVRTGVLIGTLATLLTMPLAIVLGISAGYFKGWVDDVVQYIYTTLNSIPGILLIAASVLLIDVYIETHPEDFNLVAVRADFKFLALCFILGMTSWTGLCRLLRAETLKVSQLDYVQAAHTFGVSHARTVFRHILPNVMHIVLISLVLDFSGFVLAEAVLSYIGVGVDPSMNSWGNMINEARAELSRGDVVWWPVTSAFVMMFILVLAANLFSDRVRDAFDPRFH